MTNVVPSTSTAPAGQPQQLWFHVQGCIDWLLAGPIPQPDDIRNELLQQRTNKTKTLVVAVLAALLIASIAAALTGAAWAYAWLLAEIALGSTRIYIMMKAIATAKADRRVVPVRHQLLAVPVDEDLVVLPRLQCVRRHDRVAVLGREVHGEL